MIGLDRWKMRELLDLNVWNTFNFDDYLIVNGVLKGFLGDPVV